jgi:hypothetical protein
MAFSGVIRDHWPSRDASLDYAPRMSAAGRPIDLWAPVGDGHVLITENAPGHWIVTWLPPQGDPGWPGFTYSSSLNPEMPTDDGAEGLLAWALSQPGAANTKA